MHREKPRVLLLTGGKHHDFTGGAQCIQHTLAPRFNVTATRDVADLARLADGQFAVVVFYTQGGELTDSLANTLQRFVENGGGLVGIHCAADSFSKNEVWLKLLGSQFATHGPVMEFEVRVADPTHPVVARCDNFRIVDELYTLKDHAAYKPFAVAHWQGQDRAMGYERAVGKGRVIYLANGHAIESLSNRHFQRMLERAVRVAAGESFDHKIMAGILGYGGAFNMGKYHAETIRAQAGMDVTAVCDLDPKRTSQAKTELGDSIRTYNDMDRFLAEGGFDLCIQILPHNLHAQACIKALQAGKHVITEKPFCITLQEADDMLAAAETSGKMLSCFHNRRWDGDFYTILQLVRAGRIGQVFRIDAATAGYGEPGIWWRSRKEISGGAMYDWGAHYCDWILNLANKRIASVTGDFQKRKWFGSTNEDYTYALIRFEDGTTATLEQGNIAAIPRHGWRILGTDGALSNAGPHQEITQVTFEHGRRIESKVPPAGMNAKSYYANIGNHLLLGERLVVTPQQARRAIGVIWLAGQSARQGGVPLPLPGEDKYEPDYMLPW
jgi:scyllo-inositol 2-dehydrogenase (NADP+)